MLSLVKVPAQQALNFQLTKLMHCDWQIHAITGVTSDPLRKYGKEVLECRSINSSHCIIHDESCVAK